MKYGLIGERLKHSFSKPIHEALGGYSYELMELRPEELDSFMRKKDFLGINVTIPYKSQVIPYLDYIDAVAEEIGAVNTVVNRDGRLCGYNTDYDGLRLLIKKQGFDFSGKKVLILGSGGTAKTSFAVAKSLGAGEIIIVGRKREVNYSNLYDLHSDADFIINTTPVGMYPDNFSLPVDLTRFRCLQGITDIIYNPLKTRLCLEAEKRGIPAETGIYMLVAQAAFACELFTEKSLDCQGLTCELYKKIKREKENLVLIGMPGSGKTTIGRLLAEKTGRELVDTDEMLVSRYGEISRIFEEKGEEYFREIEGEQVHLASQNNGKIIATGGGAVLKRENLDALRQNGSLFFLNRPLEELVPTDDRPLSRDYEALKKRFEERYDIYLSSADYEIKADGGIEDTVGKIMEIIK